MIKILLLLLVLFASSSRSEQIDPNYSYDDFMRQFERNYTGPQKTQHQIIFNKNYAELLDLISKGADLEVNNFLDWNQTQRQKFFTYKPQTSNIPASNRPLLSAGLFSPPPSFDWRNYNRVTPVKDQGQCGACWAFAATAQYESLLAIGTNGTLYDLAEQYAFECEKVDSKGCQGGLPITALNLYNKVGVPLESQYPYTATDNYYTSRNYGLCSEKNTIKLNYTTSSLSHFTTLTTQQIQSDLSTYGPMTVGVFSDHTAFKGVRKTGLISCTVKGAIDHAILLVGYNSTHWFVKNSWGIGWGNNGFGYIDKNNDCGLSTWVDVWQVNFPSNIIPNPPPTPTPSPSSTTDLTITMSDSYGDGWNGNILGFMQNNVVVGTFGANFTKGSSSGPVKVTINSKVQTQIVVVQKGSFTNQVGFKVTSSNGTTILSRSSGTTFNAQFIFTTFCPSSNCATSATIDYFLTMYDTWGDTWNGNILAFRQNTNIQTFSLTTNGVEVSGPNKYTFNKSVSVSIVVNALGSSTAQIGFDIRTSDGTIVFQRSAGSPFSANSILGTFCPGCVNLSPVHTVGSIEDRNSPEQNIMNQDKTQNINQSFRLATYILAPLLAIFFIISIISTAMLIRLLRSSKPEQNENANEKVESAKSITVDEKHINGIEV